jgi:hypothetical protein
MMPFSTKRFRCLALLGLLLLLAASMARPAATSVAAAKDDSTCWALHDARMCQFLKTNQTTNSITSDNEVASVTISPMINQPAISTAPVSATNTISASVRFGGLGIDWGLDVIRGSDGKMYAVGMTSSSSLSPGGQKAASFNGFVVRIGDTAPEYELLWASNLADSFRSVKEVNPTTLLVGGSACGNIRPQVNQLFGGGGGCDGILMLVQKPDFRILRTVAIGGNSNDGIEDVEVLPNGDFLVSMITESDNFPGTTPTEFTNWSMGATALMSGDLTTLRGADYIQGAAQLYNIIPVPTTDRGIMIGGSTVYSDTMNGQLAYSSAFLGDITLPSMSVNYTTTVDLSPKVGNDTNIYAELLQGDKLEVSMAILRFDQSQGPISAMATYNVGTFPWTGGTSGDWSGDEAYTHMITSIDGTTILARTSNTESGVDISISQRNGGKFTSWGQTLHAASENIPTRMLLANNRVEFLGWVSDVSAPDVAVWRFNAPPAVPPSPPASMCGQTQNSPFGLCIPLVLR